VSSPIMRYQAILALAAFGAAAVATTIHEPAVLENALVDREADGDSGCTPLYVAIV
jgi:hypothetical protein